MKKLIIKSQKHGEMTRNFESELEAQAFIEASGDHYGKMAYTETIPEVKDAEGNVIQPEQVINHEATVSFEIVDITAEIQAKKDKADKKDKDRKNRVKDLKAIDFKNINNVADLKPILKSIIDEILKDDE